MPAPKFPRTVRIGDIGPEASSPESKALLPRSCESLNPLLLCPKLSRAHGVFEILRFLQCCMAPHPHGKVKAITWIPKDLVASLQHLLQQRTQGKRS